LRQAYDYWQDQPGSIPLRLRTHARQSSAPTKGRGRFRTGAAVVREGRERSERAIEDRVVPARKRFRIREIGATSRPKAKSARAQNTNGRQGTPRCRPVSNKQHGERRHRGTSEFLSVGMQHRKPNRARRGKRSRGTTKQICRGGCRCSGQGTIRHKQIDHNSCALRTTRTPRTSPRNPRGTRPARYPNNDVRANAHRYARKILHSFLAYPAS